MLWISYLSFSVLWTLVCTLRNDKVEDFPSKEAIYKGAREVFNRSSRDQIWPMEPKRNIFTSCLYGVRLGTIDVQELYKESCNWECVLWPKKLDTNRFKLKMWGKQTWMWLKVELCNRTMLKLKRQICIVNTSPYICPNTFSHTKDNVSYIVSKKWSKCWTREWALACMGECGFPI